MLFTKLSVVGVLADHCAGATTTLVAVRRPAQLNGYYDIKVINLELLVLQ